jgi:hypothetical protein
MNDPRPVRYPPGYTHPADEDTEAAIAWLDEEARRAGTRWHGPTWNKHWPIDISPQGRLRRLIEADDEALS